MATIDRRGATVSATDAPASSTPNPDLAVKTAARVVATSNINLQTFGLGVIDGVQLAAGDRVLLTGQTDQTTNGIYNAGTGTWAMAPDFQNNSQVASGLSVFVRQGTLNASSTWHLSTADPVILGTTAITFSNQLVAVVSGLVINPLANSLNTGLIINQSVAGSFNSSSGALQLNQINISDSASITGSNGANGLNIAYAYGASPSQGSRQALQVGLTAVGAIAGSNPFLVPLATNVQANTNLGGGTGTEKGSLISASFVATSLAAATHLQELSGVEIIIVATAGSSTLGRTGLEITDSSGASGVQGSQFDNAIRLDGTGSSPGFAIGVNFVNGGLTTTATAINFTPQTISFVLDASTVTLNGGGAFLRGPSSTFVVDGAGNTQIAATASFSWVGLSKIFSPGDGVLTLQDHTASTFTRLQFGGTTSAWPALKVSGTGLRLRLADDSADTTFQALTVNATTGFQIAGAAPSGHYPRGNGTNYVDSAIQAADIQGLAPTWSAQHTWNIASTIASATAATLDDLNVQAATTTITGNTGSPITKLNKVSLYQPTLTDTSAVTVTDAATLYVDNAPVAAGSVTITNAWALRVGAGATKLQATTLSGALTYGGVTLSNSVTGTGSMVLATSPTLATPTFTTSATVPLIIGGSGTTGTQLTFQTTTGNGTTDQFAWNGGNNGGTNFALMSSTTLTFTGTTGFSLTGTGAGINFKNSTGSQYGAMSSGATGHYTVLVAPSGVTFFQARDADNSSSDANFGYLNNDTLQITNRANNSNFAKFTSAGLTMQIGAVLTKASTTGGTGFNIPSGTAPTSPNDGDMWYDGTNVKFRVGATTKTFTIT